MRTFETGATRNVDIGKPDYARCMAPSVVKAYGAYMERHAVQADGSRRDADNWKKGMPLESFMSSGMRHFVEWWDLHERGGPAAEKVEALCALLFNAQGYLYETLKEGATIEVVVDRAGQVQPQMVKPSLNPDDWKALVSTAMSEPFPHSEVKVTFKKGDRVRVGLEGLSSVGAAAGMEATIVTDTERGCFDVKFDEVVRADWGGEFDTWTARPHEVQHVRRRP